MIPCVEASDEHRRPEGLDDTTVVGLGKLTEALERVERARGHLFEFHQLIGGADAKLDEVVEKLNRAGHHALADRIETELIGMNVLQGRWTFQVLEEFDGGYYAKFRELESTARDELASGRQHIYEAEMKERRRTPGAPGHEARPSLGPPDPRPRADPP
jgi:hypothetical protein